MNKKGFTLIELLAVIIILGILMIIAIPSVTKYISDSRKNAYIDTAKEIIGAARNLVNSGKLEMFDTDTTYYINQECIETENASKSPYGDFTKAYVIVTYNGKGYDYYWTSVDDAGQGISKITKLENLDTDRIESDLKDDDIPDSLGIDDRSKYMIIDNQQTNCGKGVSTTVTDIVSGKTGTNPVTYPEGKNKNTVELGDIVKIGTEEFYIIGKNNNTLTLLAHYNLKVGNIYDYYGTKIGEYTDSDPGYGIQGSDIKGLASTGNRNGTINFSNTNYWVGKVGNGFDYIGNYCSKNDTINCVHVFDNNNNLYQYINSYKSYLEKYGVIIKEARIITKEESSNFKEINRNAWKETSYWIDSPSSDEFIWNVRINGEIYTDKYNNDYYAGIRPVIVI